MEKILEVVLTISLTVSPCIVFISIILRYSFQTSILSADRLSRYLFVQLMFIGAIVTFMDNAHVQVAFLVEELSPAWQRRIALITHPLILSVRGALAQGAMLKAIQDWNDYSPILGLPIDLVCAACSSTSPVVAFFELRHLYQLTMRSNSLTSPSQGA